MKYQITKAWRKILGKARTHPGLKKNIKYQIADNKEKKVKEWILRLLILLEI